MRPVLLSDVTAAARALIGVPEDRRVAFCRRILAEAEAADRFARRLGRPHPRWGNGTVLAAARAHPLMPEPTCDDPAYCRALVTVLSALDARRRGENL